MVQFRTVRVGGYFMHENVLYYKITPDHNGNNAYAVYSSTYTFFPDDTDVFLGGY